LRKEAHIIAGKSKISAANIVRDIRAGITESELMRKYQVSSEDVKRAVQTIADKREQLVRELVRDMRAGMSDLDLMQKYQLSSRGLQTAFTKLVKGHYMDRTELEGRLPSYGDTITVPDGRKIPRHVPAFSVPAFEEKSPAVKGLINDISEEGVQISGIEAEVDGITTLVVPEDVFGEFVSFLFEAKCRWVKRDASGECLAGFEITNISRVNLEELRYLIKAHAVTGQRE